MKKQIDKNKYLDLYSYFKNYKRYNLVMNKRSYDLILRKGKTRFSQKEKYYTWILSLLPICDDVRKYICDLIFSLEHRESFYFNYSLCCIRSNIYVIKYFRNWFIKIYIYDEINLFERSEKYDEDYENYDNYNDLDTKEKIYNDREKEFIHLNFTKNLNTSEMYEDDIFYKTYKLNLFDEISIYEKQPMNKFKKFRFIKRIVEKRKHVGYKKVKPKFFNERIGRWM